MATSVRSVDGWYPIADCTSNGIALSWIERRLYNVLDQRYVDYEPQKEFGHWRVDAYLRDFNVALEADECAYHGCAQCGYLIDDPTAPQRRSKRDALLRDTYGVTVLHVWGHDLQTDFEAALAVRVVLAPLSHRDKRERVRLQEADRQRFVEEVMAKSKTGRVSRDSDTPHTPYTLLELRLYYTLSRLRVRWRRQMMIGPYTVDAYLPDYLIAIEVDGCAVHGCPSCGSTLPHAETPERRAHRDAVLRDTHGVTVLHFWGHQLPDTDAALNLIPAALAAEGVYLDKTITIPQYARGSKSLRAIVRTYERN